MRALRVIGGVEEAFRQAKAMRSLEGGHVEGRAENDRLSHEVKRMFLDVEKQAGFLGILLALGLAFGLYLWDQSERRKQAASSLLEAEGAVLKDAAGKVGGKWSDHRERP